MGDITGAGSSIKQTATTWSFSRCRQFSTRTNAITQWAMGGFWKRATYSATRIFVTPDYHGHNSFNISELLGKGIAQGISLAYYPSRTRTLAGSPQSMDMRLGATH